MERWVLWVISKSCVRENVAYLEHIWLYAIYDHKTTVYYWRIYGNWHPQLIHSGRTIESGASIFTHVSDEWLREGAKLIPRQNSIADPAFSWMFFLRAWKGRTSVIRDDNICRFRFSSSLFPISKSGLTRCPVKLLDYVTRVEEKRSQVAVSLCGEYTRVLFNFIIRFYHMINIIVNKYIFFKYYVACTFIKRKLIKNFFL